MRPGAVEPDRSRHVCGGRREGGVRRRKAEERGGRVGDVTGWEAYGTPIKE